MSNTGRHQINGETPKGKTGSTNLDRDAREAEEVKLQQTDHDLIELVHRCKSCSLGCIKEVNNVSVLTLRCRVGSDDTKDGPSETG